MVWSDDKMTSVETETCILIGHQFTDDQTRMKLKELTRKSGYILDPAGRHTI